MSSLTGDQRPARLAAAPLEESTPPNAIASSSKHTLDHPVPNMASEGAHSGSTLDLNIPDGLTVEFRELVDKTLRQEYARLQKLTREDLPEANLSQKPLRIVNFARIARANVLRLLALYRWKVECDLEPSDGHGRVERPAVLPVNGVKDEFAAVATVGKRRLGAVSKTWGIKSLLAAQDAQYELADGQLRASAPGIFKRRRPNPDISSAVDVLSSGTFTRWPSYLAEKYEQKEPRTRKAVVDTLAALDHSLAYRVAVEEEVPTGLKVLGVRDGRVHLAGEGLFECALTALGDLPADLLLLDLKLLLRVKEGTTGAESFPADLSSEALDHTINVVVNPILRTDDGCRIEGSAQKNTALCRLYSVLRNMALSYQLQVLWSQARRLERFEWKDKIKCEMAPDGLALTIAYWTPRKNQAQPIVVPVASGPGGKIVISADAVEASAALKVSWEPSLTFLALPPDGHDGDASEFQLDNMQLDVAGLLAEVTQHHANMLIRRQHRALIKLMTDKPELRMIFSTLDDFRLVKGSGSTSMDVKVYQTHWLRFQINHTTGVLDVREAKSAGMPALQRRISLVKSTLAEAPQRLLEQVYSLKKQYVLDALETKLDYLGLQASHSMKGVPAEELERYGLASTIGGKIRSKPFFAIPTLASPLYMLVIMLQEPGFAYAFVGVRPGGPGQMQIGHFSWLDVGRILQDCPHGEAILDSRTSSFEVPAGSVNRIYAYADAKVKTLQLELQLIGKNIPYLLVQSRSNDPMPAVQVKAADLLVDDAASETSMRNILFSIVDWADARRSYAQTSIRLRRTAGSLGGMSEAVKAKRQHVRYNEATSTLIMTPPSIAGHVAWVEAEWANVSRLLSVAGQVVKLARAGPRASVSVIDFDLEQLCCAYGQDQRVTFQYDNGKSSYLIRFGSDPSAKRPLHQPVQDRLEEDFNQAIQTSSMTLACARFVKYLATSSPCLQAMMEMEDALDADLVWRNSTCIYLLWPLASSRCGLEVTLLIDSEQVKIQDVATNRHQAHSLGTIVAIQKIKSYIQRASALHEPTDGELRCELDGGSVLLCSAHSAVSIIKSLAESVSAGAGRPKKGQDGAAAQMVLSHDTTTS